MFQRLANYNTIAYLGNPDTCRNVFGVSG